MVQFIEVPKAIDDNGYSDSEPESEDDEAHPEPMMSKTQIKKILYWLEDDKKKLKVKS